MYIRPPFFTGHCGSSSASGLSSLFHLSSPIISLISNLLLILPANFVISECLFKSRLYLTHFYLSSLCSYFPLNPSAYLHGYFIKWLSANPIISGISGSTCCIFLWLMWLCLVVCFFLLDAKPCACYIIELLDFLVFQSTVTLSWAGSYVACRSAWSSGGLFLILRRCVLRLSVERV